MLTHLKWSLPEFQTVVWQIQGISVTLTLGSENTVVTHELHAIIKLDASHDMVNLHNTQSFQLQKRIHLDYLWTSTHAVDDMD